MFYETVSNVRVCMHVRRRESKPPHTGWIPKCLKQPELAPTLPNFLPQAQVRSQEYGPCLPHEWQKPKDLSHYCHLSKSLLVGTQSHESEPVIETTWMRDAAISTTWLNNLLHNSSF